MVPAFPIGNDPNLLRTPTQHETPVESIHHRDAMRRNDIGICKGNVADDPLGMPPPTAFLVGRKSRRCMIENDSDDDAEDDNDNDSDNDEGSLAAFDAVFAQRTSLDRSECGEMDEETVFERMKEQISRYFGPCGSVMVLGKKNCVFDFGGLSFIANVRLGTNEVVLSSCVYSFETELHPDETKKLRKINARLGVGLKLDALRDCVLFRKTIPIAYFVNRLASHDDFQREMTVYLMSAMGIRTDFQKQKRR